MKKNFKFMLHIYWDGIRGKYLNSVLDWNKYLGYYNLLGIEKVRERKVEFLKTEEIEISLEEVFNILRNNDLLEEEFCIITCTKCKQYFHSCNCYFRIKQLIKKENKLKELNQYFLEALTWSKYSPTRKEFLLWIKEQRKLWITV